MIAAGLLAAILTASGLRAQDRAGQVQVLTGDYRKNGEAVRNAFGFVSTGARQSVVQMSVDGKPVALGTVVGADGLVATKASELIAGKLTATLASGSTVDARVVATDEDNDLALLKIEAKGLAVVHWSSDESVAGTWVATQGLGTIPDAVGIISGIPRKILPARALMGVKFAVEGESTRVDELSPGSGAEKAGVKPGDVILAVNGQVMKTRTELVNMVREFPAGRVVQLRLQRGDEVIEVSVTLIAQTVLDAVAAAQAAAQSGRGGGGGRGGGAGGLGGAGGRGGRGARGNGFVGSGVSKRAEDFDLVLLHDTVLEPWECGGPLLDLYGRAVGLNIARAGRVASYALPAALVQKIVTDLKAQADAAEKLTAR